MKKTWWWVGGIVVVVAIFIFVDWQLVHGPSSWNNLPTGSTATSTSNGTGAAYTPGGGATAGTNTPPGAVNATTGVALQVLIPAAGESWLAGQTHAILWSAATNYTGTIVLLNASTKATVGWITPNTSRTQAQYSWNTETVTAGRNNTAAQSVTPGTYIIEVIFDGPRASIQSAPFTIIANGPETTLTSLVPVKNGYYSPDSLVVKRGQEIIVQNQDPTTAVVELNNTVLAKLPQWNSYVITASDFAPGTYTFRLQEQVLAKLTLTIQ